MSMKTYDKVNDVVRANSLEWNNCLKYIMFLLTCIFISVTKSKSMLMTSESYSGEPEICVNHISGENSIGSPVCRFLRLVAFRVIVKKTYVGQKKFFFDLLIDHILS